MKFNRYLKKVYFYSDKADLHYKLFDLFSLQHSIPKKKEKQILPLTFTEKPTLSLAMQFFFFVNIFHRQKAQRFAYKKLNSSIVLRMNATVDVKG